MAGRYSEGRGRRGEGWKWGVGNARQRRSGRRRRRRRGQCEIRGIYQFFSLGGHRECGMCQSRVLQRMSDGLGDRKPSVNDVSDEDVDSRVTHDTTRQRTGTQQNRRDGVRLKQKKKDSEF